MVRVVTLAKCSIHDCAYNCRVLDISRYSLVPRLLPVLQCCALKDWEEQYMYNVHVCMLLFGFYGYKPNISSFFTLVSIWAVTFPRKLHACSTASFSRSRWASIRVKCEKRKDWKCLMSSLLSSLRQTITPKAYFFPRREEL